MLAVLLAHLFMGSPDLEPAHSVFDAYNRENDQSAGAIDFGADGLDIRVRRETARKKYQTVHCA